VGLWPDWIVGGWGKSVGLRTFGFVPPPRIPCPNAGAKFLATLRNKVLVFVLGTEGTTSSWQCDFTEESIRICRKLGHCGVVLGNLDTQILNRLPTDTLAHFGFLPLEHLLPSALLVIHHGGIGTCAASLRYRVPQIVIPRVFAQPYNALRLQRLNLCRIVAPKDYLAGKAEKLAFDLIQQRQHGGEDQLGARGETLDANMADLCTYLEQWRSRQ
jgi:rhamnosyltransferase subunit B